MTYTKIPLAFGMTPFEVPGEISYVDVYNDIEIRLESDPNVFEIRLVPDLTYKIVYEVD